MFQNHKLQSYVRNCLYKFIYLQKFIISLSDKFFNVPVKGKQKNYLLKSALPRISGTDTSSISGQNLRASSPLMCLVTPKLLAS